MKRSEMKKLIPAKYTTSIPEVVELILSCLSENPKDRPSAEKMMYVIRNCLFLERR
jgi:hypothetical protein